MTEETNDSIFQDEEESAEPTFEARTVVITGASTGIGYGLAQELIAHGYQVIGTVRKQEDADRLRAELGNRLRPVLMDVADDEEVRRAAVRFTRSWASGALWVW